MRETIFSPCRKWRYTLWREWQSEDLFKPLARQNEYVQFIGLNPSTADETNDDPTIRRCIEFSKTWGFGAYCMTNIFAWRDTKPENMKLAPEPIGSENDRWLREIADGAGLIICAWGKHGNFKSRDLSVMKLLDPYASKIHALKINGDGSPQHPLYIHSETKPQIFNLK